MSPALTYTNPVYPHYFADPFVLRHEGFYYAYGTAPSSADGWQFPVLRSSNLADWELHGWALSPLAGANAFWAPEVAVHEGVFYLYYSASGIQGRDHQLRVAISSSPLGPFEDTGRSLVPDEPFTIDAHPFQDIDGQWFLFYARDFLALDGDYRIGTGIVVDKLVDMVTLAGDPRAVVRPYADWQLYERQRTMYGAVYDWHTVEGAALRLHNGRYYCFFSGGAWERENYGVAYVVADHVLGPYNRPPGADVPLLRSVPGKVIGPGHHSFTEGSEGREYVIYHGWDSAKTARLMRVDRLTWDGDRPVLHGPTWTPQPVQEVDMRKEL